jgi:hypothetical protein
MFAACSRERQPAEHLMAGIEVAVAGAPDAAKYVPEELNDVESRLAVLKSLYDKQDYKGVLQTGPALLREAQNLSTAAAARKAEILRELNNQWASLSTVVPAKMSAVQNRIETLSKKPNDQSARGIDLAGAKSAIAGAGSLWSKAQGAFGNGNMDEAVATARAVRAKLDAISASLKMDMPISSAAANSASRLGPDD